MSIHWRRARWLAIAWCTAVFAAPPDPSTEQPQPELNEIVVTAQRRSEALQDVPIAVSAFTPEMLESKRIDTGPELVMDLPNVTAAKSYFGGFNVQIRGIGTPLGTASSDSGVGIHLNNVPLTSSRFFEAEFFDISQVEVLRGPQGTLYGRNATGGVVNVKTAMPSDTFSALANVEGADYGTFKAKGMLNLPLGDGFALRLAASYLRRSGFGENTYNGEDVDGRDLFSTRVTLGFTPNESLKATLMWQHFGESDTRLRAGSDLCTKDPGPASVGGVAVTDTITRGLLSQGCADASIYTPQAHSTPNSLATLFGILPQLFGVTSGDYNAGSTVSSNLHDTQSYFSPKYQARNDIIQLDLEYRLASNLTLSSLTGYLKDDVDNFGDFFGYVPTAGFNATPLTPAGVFNDPQLGALSRSAAFTRFTQPSEQYTQELRVQSDFAGPMNFAFGANYLHYKTNQINSIDANTLTMAAEALNGGVPCALGNSACIYIDPYAGTGGTVGHNYYVNETPLKLRSEAAFGEFYYSFTDDLKLTLGARYTHDHKEQTNIPVPLLQPGSGLTIGSPATLVSDFKTPTGRIGLDYSLHRSSGDRSLLYAFYSRGYKAGGSNAPAAVGVGSVKANFDPEYVNAFEVGMKNTFLEGRLTANLTAFYYNYSNYQVAEIVSETQVVQNVNARLAGLEFESTWRPIRPLQMDLTAGLLRTRLRNSEAIDPLNITNGDPGLTLVKSSAAGNCAAPTAALSNLIAIIEQQPGAPHVTGVSGNPAALLGVCGGAYSGLGIVPSQGEATQLDGHELPNAPSWTVSLGTQYTWSLRDNWTTTLRGDFYAQGNSYARIYNTAVDRLRGWQDVNTSLQFSNGRAWQAQLFVKNVFDKQPVVNLFFADAVTGSYAQGFTIEPRVYGANVTVSF
jgi:outer membrane receptor protein involved in Fe transport